MNALAQQRCLNHFGREAVARCPECTQFFCRECVTEHDDRVVCTGCLRKLVGRGESKRNWTRSVWRMAQTAGGVALLWLIFYGIGAALLNIPSDFHNGEFWKR